MDGFNIYSDLVSQNIEEQNEAINKVQEEILEKTNSLQSRAEKAVEEIGSGVLLKEGLGRAISYVGSRIGGTAGKVVSDAASDYAQGGVPKVIEGLTTKGIQAAKNLATKALNEDAGDVIQMDPLAELETPIEGSANPTFIGENADVEDELTGFGEEAGEEGAEVAPEFVPPTNEAISAAADLEDGLTDEISTSMFDNVVSTGEDVVQTGEDPIAAATAAASSAGEDALNAASAAASSAVEDASGAVSSAISAVGSGIEDAGIAATSALSDAAAAAAAAASGAVSGVSAAAAGGVATALEAGGAALDATGVGAIAGVVLGIGGVLASVFAPGMNETQDIPPLPNFSYQIGV